MSWLKERWRWLVAGLVFLIGLVVFSFRRRSSSPTEGKRVEVEKRTQELEREAEEKRNRLVDTIQTEHAKDVAELEAEQRERTEQLRDKPDETNEFLKDVGKRMREP